MVTGRRADVGEAQRQVWTKTKWRALAEGEAQSGFRDLLELAEANVANQVIAGMGEFLIVVCSRIQTVATGPGAQRGW